MLGLAAQRAGEFHAQVVKIGGDENGRTVRRDGQRSGGPSAVTTALMEDALTTRERNRRTTAGNDPLTIAWAGTTPCSTESSLEAPCSPHTHR